MYVDACVSLGLPLVVCLECRRPTVTVNKPCKHTRLHNPHAVSTPGFATPHPANTPGPTWRSWTRAPSSKRPIACRSTGCRPPASSRAARAAHASSCAAPDEKEGSEDEDKEEDDEEKDAGEVEEDDDGCSVRGNG